MMAFILFQIISRGKVCCPNSLLFLMWIIFSAITSQTQSVRYPLAARYTGLGVYSKNNADAFSFQLNQAALANLKSMGSGVYAERRFLLEELNFYSLAVAFPLQFGGIGISAKYFGFPEYNETQLGLAYAKPLGKIDVGIQFNYHSIHLPGYGKDALFYIEAGVIIHISEELYAGFHVFNPTGSKFGHNNVEKLASVYTAGLGYEASDKVFLSAEIIKEQDKPVNINAGLQYVFAKKFFARIGLLTETSNLYCGVGLKWSRFRIDITNSYHPQLGFTPGLLILFEGPAKE